MREGEREGAGKREIIRKVYIYIYIYREREREREREGERERERVYLINPCSAT